MRGTLKWWSPKCLAAVEAVLLQDLDIVVEDIDGELVAVLADGGSLEMAVGGYMAGEGDPEWIAVGVGLVGFAVYVWMLHKPPPSPS